MVLFSERLRFRLGTWLSMQLDEVDSSEREETAVKEGGVHFSKTTCTQDTTTFVQKTYYAWCLQIFLLCNEEDKFWYFRVISAPFL